MSNNLGVNDLKELLSLVFSVVKVGKGVMADGKIDLSDVITLTELLPYVIPAIDGAGNIPAELSDLSEQEAQELIAYVMLQISVDDVKARAIINSSFKCAFSVYELVKAIKS